MFKKVFDFFVFTSLFIAVCAVLMTYQTAFLFHIPMSFSLAGFVFFGTVCSYNFHWFLTPPDVEKTSPKLAWNISNRNLHLSLFMIGLAGSAIFTFLLINHWFWLGITAFITFMYSAPKIPFPMFKWLREIAVGKTIFLALSWTHVTSVLPLVISLKTLTLTEVWFVVNRFFYIYAICILFDYRDLGEDRKAGIKSLITYLNEPGIDMLFWASMFIFTITSFLMGSSIGWVAVAALLIPGIILGLLYYPSKKNFSDYRYYFVLDGLMMLSAPLLLLFKFAR